MIFTTDFQIVQAKLYTNTNTDNTVEYLLY